MAIDAEVGGEPLVLVTGPRLRGRARGSAPTAWRLAWLQWHHPDMPWDGTELVVAEPGQRPRRTARSASPGWSPEGRDESITQPEWHADGSLWFVSDRSDWWNLHRIGADSVLTGGPAEPMAPIDGEVGMPAWVFGQSRYTFLGDGRVALAYAAGGTDHLAVLTPAGEGADGSHRPASLTDLQTDHVALSALQADGHGLVFVGATASREAAVTVLDLPTDLASGAGATLTVIRPPRDLGLDAGWIAEPRHLEVATTDGGVAHALLLPADPPDGGGAGGARRRPCWC